MRILITGGAGFIGCNLAVHFAARGHAVTLFDNLSRRGAADNLDWIRGQHADSVRFVRGDVRDSVLVRHAVAGCDAVFHLASQVAVTTSVADPRLDLEVNTLGTFNVLEVARASSPMPAVIFTSTNKVYGAMEDVAVTRDGERYVYRDCPVGIDESRPLDFHSPYGCSKGAADQYARDYHRIYGLPTVVFRMSCVYGPRQFGTEDQGWVAHFLISGLLGKPMTIYGDGMQVRDILHVDDLVRLFEAALARLPVAAGQVYNVGGGPANSISLLELVGLLEELLGRAVPVSFEDWRPGDQPIYISNVAKAERELGWAPVVCKRDGLLQMFAWVQEHRNLFEG